MLKVILLSVLLNIKIMSFGLECAAQHHFDRCSQAAQDVFKDTGGTATCQFLLEPRPYDPSWGDCLLVTINNGTADTKSNENGGENIETNNSDNS